MNKLFLFTLGLLIFMSSVLAVPTLTLDCPASVAAGASFDCTLRSATQLVNGDGFHILGYNGQTGATDPGVVIVAGGSFIAPFPLPNRVFDFDSVPTNVLRVFHFTAGPSGSVVVTLSVEGEIGSDSFGAGHPFPVQVVSASVSIGDGVPPPPPPAAIDPCAEVDCPDTTFCNPDSGDCVDNNAAPAVVSVDTLMSDLEHILRDQDTDGRSLASSRSKLQKISAIAYKLSLYFSGVAQ